MNVRLSTTLQLTLFSTILMGAIWWNASASSQQDRISRVGLLNPNSPAIARRYVEAFRDELRRLGYVEHRNLVIEARYAEGNAERLNALAAELAQHKVDVLFAPTEPALKAAKEAGAGIPIVTVSCDPLEKLLGSLSRPGGNATGFSCVSSDLAGKRLNLLKSLVPNLKNVAMLYNVWDAYEPDLRNVETSAQVLGLSVGRFPVQSMADFEPAFAAMEKEGRQAVYISLSGFANFHRRTFAQLALKHRLPSVFGFREFPEEGGLLSYGASNSDGYRRAAYFVDRILKGASPKDLPAEEPTRFELVINAKTAAALGLTIPNAIFVQADEVIE